MLPNATEIPAGLIESEEDVISYCIFPEVALEYFKWRALPTEERPIRRSCWNANRKSAVNKQPAKATPEVQRLLSDADYRELERPGQPHRGPAAQRVHDPPQ
jgi:hypothetical protein